MIYTYSILKGYKSIMGNAVLHMPLLVASLIYIGGGTKGLGPAIDRDLGLLFSLQMIVHVLNSVIWLCEINLKLWKRMDIFVEVSSILALIFQFIVFMLLFTVYAQMSDDNELGPIS